MALLRGSSDGPPAPVIAAVRQLTDYQVTSPTAFHVSLAAEQAAPFGHAETALLAIKIFLGFQVESKLEQSNRSVMQRTVASAFLHLLLLMGGRLARISIEMSSRSILFICQA